MRIRHSLLLCLPAIPLSICRLVSGAPSSAPMAAPVPIGIGRAIPREATCDFGKLSVKPGEVVSRIVILRNDTRESLTIESLTTSCRCTTTELTGTGVASNAATPPYTVPPGKTVGVRISVDSGENRPFDLRKMVWVNLRGMSKPTLTLTVTGLLSAPVKPR